VRVANWWEGREFGVEDVTAVSGTEGAEAMARGLFADEWTISGGGGGPLRMPTQNIMGRLIEGSAACTKTRGTEGELTLRGSIGAGARYAPETGSQEIAQPMYADEVSSLVFPDEGLYIRLLWQDQPFELYQRGQLVATFQSAAEYSAMRRTAASGASGFSADGPAISMPGSAGAVLSWLSVL
jgi:hypothetical protein